MHAGERRRLGALERTDDVGAHAGRAGRCQTGIRVFEHDDVVGVQTELPRRAQIGVGGGLAVHDIFRGNDHSGHRCADDAHACLRQRARRRGDERDSIGGQRGKEGGGARDLNDAVDRAELECDQFRNGGGDVDAGGTEARDRLFSLAAVRDREELLEIGPVPPRESRPSGLDDRGRVDERSVHVEQEAAGLEGVNGAGGRVSGHHPILPARAAAVWDERDGAPWLQPILTRAVPAGVRFRRQNARMASVVQIIRSLVSPLTRTRLFRWAAPTVLPVLERLVTRLSGGRAQLSGLLVPSLVLHSIGAKSGVERDAELMYTPDGRGNAIIAGTSFARDRHPAWSYNLIAHPDAAITVRGRRRPVRAELLEAAERDAAWRLIEAQWPGYRGYERESGRIVRLFRLRLQPE